jgi:hypothetical protein
VFFCRTYLEESNTTLDNLTTSAKEELFIGFLEERYKLSIKFVKYMMAPHLNTAAISNITNGKIFGATFTHVSIPKYD